MPRNTKFWLVAGAALFLGAPLHAQEQPEIQIDMSVLNAMQPAAGRDSYATRPVLQPPAAGRLSGPSLTGEDAAEPSPPVAAAVMPPSEHVLQSGIVHFPIAVKERTEQADPSLGMTTMEDEEKDREPARRPTFMPPLPDLKPIPIADYHKPMAKVPVPGKRPDIAKASENFVREARRIEAERVSSLAMDKDATVAVMPAVRLEEVKAETLEPAPIADSDALARQLVRPDRESMIKSVETIAAMAQTLMPAASSKKKAKIVSEPMDITEQVARIEPAAGSPDKRIPRPPPEGGDSDYISLPFAAGAAALDQAITQTLGSEVLPKLKNNPDWRVQIQAFAGGADGEVNEARRVSLSRALAVRSYLMEQGIEARRMDVRALGMQTDRNPADRVDFVFLDPAHVN